VQICVYVVAKYEYHLLFDVLPSDIYKRNTFIPYEETLVMLMP